MFLFKRGKVYHCEYYDDTLKKKKRITTKCQTKSDATKYMYMFFKELEVSRDLTNISFEKFVEQYIIVSKQSYSKSYSQRIEEAFKKLGAYVGNPTLYEIKSNDMERFIMLTYERAPASAHNYLIILKAAFNKAIRLSHTNKNPFASIKLPKKQKRIPVTVSREQLDLIIRVTENPMLRFVFIVAYYTGLRISELEHLQWQSIDFARREITVKNYSTFRTKNRKDRIVPMTKTVYEQLQDLKKSKRSEFVFTKNNGMRYQHSFPSKKFKQYSRRVGLNEEIHFHSLRHSFASNLVRKGVSLYIVKELLGHANITTTMMYAHLDNSSLVKAVDLLEE